MFFTTYRKNPNKWRYGYDTQDTVIINDWELKHDCLNWHIKDMNKHMSLVLGHNLH